MTGGGGFGLSPQRAELLRVLLRAEGIEPAPARTVPRRPDPTAPVPLTSSQSRMWFLDRFTTHRSAFVIPTALTVRGDFRLELFARACEEVVRRHESLRTVFGDVDGRPLQQVRDGLPPEVRIVDLPGLAPAAVRPELQRRTAELAGRPFDLRTGPLLRVELARLAPDTAAVLLVVHHIVADLWSMAVLQRELLASYAALAAGRSSDLPELPVQYPDFALWQHESPAEARWESDLAYWRRQLAGIPPESTLPVARPRPREKTFRGSSVPVELAPAVVSALRELARVEEASPFMVLAAAVTVLLARLAGDDDVVLGTPVANRPLPELEPLIGFFVNTLTLRTHVVGNPPFRAVLRDVRRVCLEAYEHQELPFDRLVEELRPQRSLARTPLFQVMFAYRDIPLPELAGVPVRVEPVPLQSAKAEFDLLVDLAEHGDGISGYLEYSLDLYEESTALRIAGAFQHLVAELVADPDRRLATLSAADCEHAGGRFRSGADPLGEPAEPGEPEWDEAGDWAEYEPPRDDLEDSLVVIWRDVLRVERVGVHDDFFALGGHSMLASQLAARVTGAYGVELPIRELFYNPTVAELAAWVRGRVTRPATGIPTADRRGSGPLSFAQEHLYLHHPLGPEHPVHNVVTGIVLSGAADESALESSLVDVAARHEALRTRFPGRPGEPVQDVVDTASWPLEVVDLREVPASRHPAELRRLVEAAGQRPFRLDAAPLLRALLVRLADDRSALVLVMHHLVTDNWSYGVLVRDYCAFYRARVLGGEPVLPELPVQYPDYAAWQRGEVRGGALDDQLSFWRRQLADLPVLRFTAPEATGAATGHVGSFVLDAALAHRLTEIARQEGTTLFVVLLAAFAVLLSAYSGSDDIPVNFPESGRDRTEIADLVGFFVNILVVRADLSAAPSFRGLLAQVRERTQQAYGHPDIPLYAFDGEPGGGLRGSRVRFNLLNAPVPAVDLPGLVAEPLDLGTGFVFSELHVADIAPSEVDLALVMREDRSGLRGTWLYSLDAVDARALAAMMRAWSPLLHRVAAEPDIAVADLRRSARSG